MSDFENSDDENYSKKDDYDEFIKKSKTSNRKILPDEEDTIANDSEVDEDEDEINDDLHDLDDDFDDDFDQLKNSDENLEIKDILSKEKTSSDIKDDVLYDLENDSLSPINSDVESDDENDLQKLENDLNHNYVKKNHPECLYLNNDEIQVLSQIVRDENGIIIDENHKTLPIMTKYEKTKILGQRAKQINNGDKPYVNVSEKIIDGYIISEMELKQKKIPYIIRRPLGNGTSEYWKISDLELI